MDDEPAPECDQRCAWLAGHDWRHTQRPSWSGTQKWQMHSVASREPARPLSSTGGGRTLTYNAAIAVVPRTVSVQTGLPSNRQVLLLLSTGSQWTGPEQGPSPAPCTKRPPLQVPSGSPTRDPTLPFAWAEWQGDKHLLSPVPHRVTLPTESPSQHPSVVQSCGLPGLARGQCSQHVVASRACTLEKNLPSGLQGGHPLDGLSTTCSPLALFQWPRPSPDWCAHHRDAFLVPDLFASSTFGGETLPLRSSCTQLNTSRVRFGPDYMHIAQPRNANKTSPSLNCACTTNASWIARLNRMGISGSPCSPLCLGNLVHWCQRHPPTCSLWDRRVWTWRKATTLSNLEHCAICPSLHCARRGRMLRCHQSRGSWRLLPRQSSPWCEHRPNHLPELRGNVCATKLRNEIPLAMSRALPSFIYRAVLVASMKHLVTHWDVFSGPCPGRLETRTAPPRRRPSRLSTSRECIHLALEQTQLVHWSSTWKRVASRTRGCPGAKFGTSAGTSLTLSRGLRSCNSLRVSSVFGARVTPVNSCLARCCSAATSCDVSPTLGPNMLHRASSTSVTHSPLENLSSHWTPSIGCVWSFHDDWPLTLLFKRPVQTRKYQSLCSPHAHHPAVESWFSVWSSRTHWKKY